MLTEMLSSQRDDLVVGALATMTSLALATLMMWAGAEKLRSPEPTASVIVGLVSGFRWARPATAMLAVTELAIAVGLVWCPGSRVLLAAVVCLATLFATAGWLAMRAGKRISCSCFGSAGKRPLGRSQIVAFPAWVGACFLLLVAAPDIRPLATTTMLLALIAMTMALVRAPKVMRALLRARGDRHSATEMFEWLP
jgi:hypothetical protein